MDVKIDKGTVVPRHTHPGIESAYVMDGSIEVPVQGQETKVHKAGEAFQIPPETPRAGGKAPVPSDGERPRLFSSRGFLIDRMPR